MSRRDDDREIDHLRGIIRDGRDADNKARVWADEALACAQSASQALSGPEAAKYRRDAETAGRKADGFRNQARKVHDAMVRLAALERGRRR